MIKSQKEIKALIGLTVLLIVSLVTMILFNENLFALALKRYNSMDEILFYINNRIATTDIFIVKFAMSASAMNFSFLTIIQSISFNSVLAFVSQLIFFDLLKYSPSFKSLRINLLINFILNSLKYFTYVIIILINFSNFMTISPLLNSIANVMLTYNVIMFINLVAMIGHYFYLRKRVDTNVRVD